MVIKINLNFDKCCGLIVIPSCIRNTQKYKNILWIRYTIGLLKYCIKFIENFSNKPLDLYLY